MNALNPPKQPRLPRILSQPLTLIPQPLSAHIVIKSLNILLAQAIAQGDVDFLQAKSVSVEIKDLQLKFALTLNFGQLRSRIWQPEDDLNLSGHVYDFMQLATRQEDSDTLFFHRRLKMSGDTELGLEVKNLLDGMDIKTVRFHQQLDFILSHGIKIMDRFFA